MAWIHVISPAEASGLLKREYEAALQRAGRIWNIVRIMSFESSSYEDLDGFLQCANARPIASQPQPARNAGDRGVCDQPLRLLNSGPCE